MRTTATTGAVLGATCLIALWATPARGWQTDPIDQRPLRTLNSSFPFQPPPTLEAWESRRQWLRRHVQICLGLWPFPERTALNAVVHGRIDCDGYSIEKVYFESLPGFLVTGNLYRPLGLTGRRPAILCPHGHFNQGRFLQVDEEGIRREIELGAERFPSNARSPLQARCANLARMGCVVFHYDMVGYADCGQISHAVAHGFRVPRPDMHAAGGHGFFSPRAELQLQSIMGLQTWNSIRSLDFVAGLPDVDPQRIAVTGASGGGTQTFILCAVDDRPVAAFPAVMVSTAMQGGCTCENCCNLRVTTGNVELAALFAPKPLGLTAADDWTRDMASDGYPQLQTVYRMYAAGPSPGPAGNSGVELTARLEFGHNYNQVSREAMYRFMNRHLQLGLDAEQITERPVRTLTPAELTVFNQAHPAPSAGPDAERSVLRHWQLASRIRALDPQVVAAEGMQKARAIVLPALQSMVLHPAQATPRLEWSSEAPVRRQQRLWRRGQIVGGGHDMSGVPIALSEIREDALTTQDRPVRIRIDLKQDGLRFLNDSSAAEGTRTSAEPTICSGTVMVSLAWPAGQAGSGALATNRMVDNGREAAGYTFGYNRTLFARRVSRLLHLLKYLNHRYPQADVEIHADAATTPVAIVARALTPGAIGLRGQLNGFRFGNVEGFRDPGFFPGAAKYGDVDAFLALRSDGPVTIQGESAATMPLSAAAWRQAGRTGALEWIPGSK